MPKLIPLPGDQDKSWVVLTLSLWFLFFFFKHTEREATKLSNGGRVDKVQMWSLAWIIGLDSGLPTAVVNDMWHPDKRQATLPLWRFSVIAWCTYNGLYGACVTYTHTIFYLFDMKSTILILSGWPVRCFDHKAKPSGVFILILPCPRDAALMEWYWASSNSALVFSTALFSILALLPFAIVADFCLSMAAVWVLSAQMRGSLERDKT